MFSVKALKLSDSDSSKNLLIGNIYCSPSSTLENDNSLYDLLDYIEQHFSVPKLVVGDFTYSKINWYQVSGFGICAQCSTLNDNEMAFVNALRENSLLQQVVNPTRQRGTDTLHILDLVLTSENFVTEIEHLNVHTTVYYNLIVSCKL